MSWVKVSGVKVSLGSKCPGVKVFRGQSVSLDDWGQSVLGVKVSLGSKCPGVKVSLGSKCLWGQSVCGVKVSLGSKWVWAAYATSAYHEARIFVHFHLAIRANFERGGNSYWIWTETLLYSKTYTTLQPHDGSNKRPFPLKGARTSACHTTWRISYANHTLMEKNGTKVLYYKLFVNELHSVQKLKCSLHQNLKN